MPKLLKTTRKKKTPTGHRTGRRRVVIRREGWYYLLVLGFIVVGVVFRQVNLLVMLAGLMTGLFVLNWRMVVKTLLRVDVTRRLPERICVGDLLVVDLQFHNRRRRLASWAIRIEDQIRRVVAGGPRGVVAGGPRGVVAGGPEGQDGRRRSSTGGYRVSSAVLIPQVEAEGVGQASYRCVLRRRGRYQFGPITISTGFPLGLVHGVLRLRKTDTLLACPQLGRLTPAWRRLLEGRRHGQYRSQHKKGLMEGDFFGMRDWRPGDSRRWIHWRTSAKVGEMTVKQYEEQRNRDVVLLVDLWRPSSASEVDEGAVEVAVSFAATVVSDLCRRGGSYLITAVAGRRFWKHAAAASSVFMEAILAELAVVEAGGGEQFIPALEHIAEETHHSARVIIISTRERPTTAKMDLGPDPSKNGSSTNGPAADGFKGGFMGEGRAVEALLARAAWIDVRSEQLNGLFLLAPPLKADEFTASLKRSRVVAGGPEGVVAGGPGGDDAPTTRS